MSKQQQWTAKELAEFLNASLEGNSETVITGANILEKATPEELSLIGDAAYNVKWQASNALVALTLPGLDVPLKPNSTLLRVKDIDLAMAKLLEQLAPKAEPIATGIHPLASVDSLAHIDPTASIGPFAIVQAYATIGKNSVIHGHAHVMPHSRVGEDCEIHPHVVVYPNCIIGDRCVLQAHVTIGADGFGYRPDENGFKKIPHIAAVTLGNDIEIGCHTAIDCGKYTDTFIDDGCKFDNHVHIAHNCSIGKMVILTAGVTIGGSTTLEDFVQIGGNTTLVDHVTVGKGAKIAGSSAVFRDVEPGATLGGVPAIPIRQFWRLQAVLKQLPDLFKKWQQYS